MGNVLIPASRAMRRSGSGAALALTLLIAPVAAAAHDRPACPEGFEPQAGLNKDFEFEGQKRAFIVVPPVGDTDRLAPVWVPMSGTVESANWNLHVLRSGNNAKLAEAGFMVIAPIRQCAEQDPDLAAGACNGPGSNGWNWNPWNDGRAAGPEGDKWRQDAGPDARFFKAMVGCVATRWKLDRKRYYIGGISAGGTMTNRALLFDSHFWAGGMPISGEWYVGNDDGSPLSFNDARAAVAADPKKVFQGRVGPHPLPARLGPEIVITVWGGEKDLWDCGGAIGLCADYRPSTQAASNYFSSQPNVVHVACSSTHGHMWPQIGTDAFNLWALRTLASHPKGSSPESFRLTPPPDGYACKIGRFEDHY